MVKYNKAIAGLLAVGGFVFVAYILVNKSDTGVLAKESLLATPSSADNSVRYGQYINNLDSNARLIYTGDSNIYSDSLAIFRYRDYDNNYTIEAYPLRGSWDTDGLNSDTISVNSVNFKLNVETGLSSDYIHLGYRVDKGRFILTYSEVKNALCYNIYKNGNLLATSEDLEFSDFSLSDTDSLVYNGSEIISKQNSGLHISDEFYVKPVLQDNTEGSVSNTIKIKDVAGSLPVEVDNSYLELGRTYSSPKDLPRSVKIKLLDGSYSYYNVDYKIDESTRFTSKLYYRYYINNTELRGFVAVDTGNSINIPSNILNGSIHEPFSYSKLNVIETEKLVKKSLDLSEYISNSTPLSSDKELAYRTLSEDIRNRNTDLDLSRFSLSREDFIDIASQLEMDFYYILNSITLDRDNNSINVEYNDKSIESFADVESVYKYISENNLTDNKEIASLGSLGLSGAKVVKGTRLGNEVYVNLVELDGNFYYINFSLENRELFMCSSEQAKDVGYNLHSKLLDIECNDNSKEYYTVNGLLANNLDEYTSILKMELEKDSFHIRVKYAGNEINSEDIVNTISNVFTELNKRDLLSRVKFSDNNKIYTVFIGE